MTKHYVHLVIEKDVANEFFQLARERGLTQTRLLQELLSDWKGEGG